jgi:hypothetical protein
MAMSDFIEFLSQPAEDDSEDEIKRWVVFMACPNCKAQYPVFHSPAGTTGTLCDDCGWSSDDQGGRT